MSLANLTLSSVEHYGGIDLKRNANKYLGGAFGTSLLLHAVIVLGGLLMIGLFQSPTTSSVPPVIRPVDFLPPPSVEEPVKATLPQAPQVAQGIDPHAIPLPVDHPLPPVSPIIPPAAIPREPLPVGSNPPSPPIGDPPQPHRVVAPMVSIPPKDTMIFYDQEPVARVNINSIIQYPEAAKRAGLEGTVLISALIGTDGAVEKIEVERSDYKMLEEAAVKAMAKVTFRPALQDSLPVRVWYTFPITFRLQK